MSVIIGALGTIKKGLDQKLAVASRSPTGYRAVFLNLCETAAR